MSSESAMPPAGWYNDPSDPNQERYWNGHGWSPAVRPLSDQQRAGEYAAGQPYSDVGYAPGNETLNRGGYAPGDTAYDNHYAAEYGQAHYGYQPSAPAGPTTADGVPLAEWWRRLVATVIDSVLLNLVTSQIVTLATIRVQAGLTAKMAAWTMAFIDFIDGNGSFPNPFDPTYGLTYYILVSTAITLGISFLYGFLFLRFTGRTLGQMALGIHVVPADQGRHVGGLGWGMAAIRQAAWVILNEIPFINLINGLMPLFTKRRVTLHDMLARTQVTYHR